MRAITAGCLLAAWLCAWKIRPDAKITFVQGSGRRFRRWARLGAVRTQVLAEVEEGLALPALMARHEAALQEVRSSCGQLPEDFDDVRLLRFVLHHSGDAKAAAGNVREVIAWRRGEGAEIVAAAADALAAATKGGRWDNEQVLARAPASAKISQHIKATNMLILSTSRGDLVTCISAAGLSVASLELMKAVDQKDLLDFFLYTWEINTQVMDTRTRASGRLVRGYIADNLQGIGILPDRRMLDVVREASNTGLKLWPGFNGLTVLFNLPWVADLFANFFLKLVPASVRDTVMFKRGLMDGVDDLTVLLREPEKSRFLKSYEALVYK